MPTAGVGGGGSQAGPLPDAQTKCRSDGWAAEKIRLPRQTGYSRVMFEKMAQAQFQLHDVQMIASLTGGLDVIDYHRLDAHFPGRRLHQIVSQFSRDNMRQMLMLRDRADLFLG
jgi:hypothetical protein